MTWTATWPKPSHVSKKVGSGTFLKQFFFTGMFLNFFFYKVENQNAPKLQGRIAYLSQKM